METIPLDIRIYILTLVMREHDYHCKTLIERDATRARVLIDYDNISSCFDFTYAEVDEVQRIFGKLGTVVEINCTKMLQIKSNYTIYAYTESADSDILDEWLDKWPVDRVILDFTDLWWDYDKQQAGYMKHRRLLARST